jgi:2-C-methyl-D-erythritol 4-phosphate cytidylyltransferase/2-C-methyl-D-erythritol 2,4-cyclodiphosphate synthase
LQAIVVAAGSGERFGRPKALVEVFGRPLVCWSVRPFLALRAERVVVVGRAEDLPRLASALPPEVRVVAGGATRSASVRRGFEALDPALGGPVLVHDAARPLVTEELVRRVAEAVEEVALPVLPVDDTLRAETSLAGPLPARGSIVRAQTPQGFAWSVLAAVVASGAVASDEAQVAEALGYRVVHVPGARRNLKVTWPEDLGLVEALLAWEEGEAVRVGQGYDVHRLVPGRALVLGGVPIPPEETGGLGLMGHSDADVVLHAVMDAMLGASGLPDIGVLFPPSDERLRGIDSALLTAEVLRRVAAEGFVPVAVDVTVVAERPKLAPHREAIRTRLAELLGLNSPARVGFKATTPEGLGPLGQGEGIAALALVTLVHRHRP